MRASEIREGGFYIAKVSNKLTTVRVDSIRSVTFGGLKHGSRTRYDVTNIATGRKTTFRAASKFRREVPKPTIVKG